MRVTVFDADFEVDASLIDAETSTVRTQIVEYEQGERSTFDVRIRFPDGLTGEVMCCMLEIPYGETRTYGELAARLDTAPVAVGQACGRNPVPILVPCHRVVGADSLGGFSSGGERGQQLKRRLLAHERRHAPTESGQTTLVDWSGA